MITNQAGQFYDIIVDGPVEFQASQPIQVAHFANGNVIRSIMQLLMKADPCEILVPPVNHYLETNIVFALPNDSITGDFDQNYLNLIVAKSALTNTLVNGSTIAATNFIPIGASGFCGTQVMVSTGTNIIISSQPVGVEAYGFGQEDAYGYFGGIVQ